MINGLAPRMPSLVSQHSFARVPSVSIERSRFDRSHSLKTAFDADYLIPIYVDEVLPGDTFNLRMSAFCRTATPLKPILDNLHLETFFFFVPNRLLWTNFEKFCGAQTNPGDSISYTIPTIPIIAGGPEINTLADYFGIPTDMTNAFSVNTLPFRAYNRVYNEWFRDENLVNSVTVDSGDGPDTYANYVLLKRGKRHDYFTSALPWPQKGTAVSLPVGASTALVTRVSNSTTGRWKEVGTNTNVGDDADLRFSSAQLVGATVAKTVNYDPDGSLIADLSTALATTVNELRTALQTQVLLERDARGGTRYVELLKSHFGVVSPDFRLQRSEYLGGGSSAINIHPVPVTAKGDASVTGATGALAAFGTASFSGHGFSKSFTEHGYIIGLANVRADLTYSQGLDRMWFRSTRYDFYWPALAHLGEQSILNKEIYNDLADGTSSNQRSGVFGYQERYAEYRYKPSRITSVLRPAYATPLDTWHLSEKFTSQPSLNSTFIASSTGTPLDRCIAVPTEPQILMDAYFQLTCARPMPVYAVPTLGDRL